MSYHKCGLALPLVFVLIVSQGSSTGRVIITQPPLQQILHEINVYGPQRPSLQDELEKGWQEGRPPDIPKPGEAPLWDEDDAYSQGLIVTVLRATAAGNWLSNRKKRQLVLPWIPQYGLLRAILPHTIDQPFELHKDEGQGEEEGQGLEGATMMSSGSLADYWKEKGFAYTKEEEARIRQVVVEVRMDAFRRARTNYDDDGGIDALPPTLTLTYPADKVFRRPYRAYQPSSPSQSLQTSGSSTQVQAVGTVPIVGVNTTVTAVSHRSRPGRYPPTTMTLSEELEGHEEDGPSMEGEEGEEEEVMVYNDQEEDDDDMGHGEGEEKLLLRPRQAFIAPEGYVLVSADYCQIELRILAHFSGDGNLCSAISSGEDVFKTLAANWHHVREEEVTAAQRKHAKTIAYGIIYGQGVAALAKRLEVSPNQAAALRTSFLEAYPGITTFVEDTKANCRSRGYVETLLGRRRYLPNINSPDKDKAAHAQRQSVNTKCQGSAADLIKLAMINIHRRLDKELQAAPGLPSSSSNTIVASALPSSRPCRLVLQVHDELVFEVDHRWLPRVVPIIRDSMQRAVRLQVPLKVQIRKGHNWSDLSPLLT